MAERQTGTLKPLDSLVCVWLAATGSALFLLFGWDKWQAKRAGRRVPEWLLAALGAVGGWPGGLVGIWVFRHKTAKAAFRLKYGLAFLWFAALLFAWKHWR